MEAQEGMVFYMERKDLPHPPAGLQGDAEDLNLDALGTKDGLEDPVPVGFNIGLCGGKAYESFIQADNEAFCGVVKNTSRADLCKLFLQYVQQN